MLVLVILVFVVLVLVVLVLVVTVLLFLVMVMTRDAIVGIEAAYRNTEKAILAQPATTQ